jgi:putative intracellular protease/amidase
MAMKILILAYDGCAEFEVTLLGYLARGSGFGVVVAGPDGSPEVTGLGGFRLKIEVAVSQAEVEGYDALVVPGGEWESLIDDEAVSGLIRSFAEAGKLVAAICAGPLHLAKAGVLAGRAYTTSLSSNRRGLFDWERKQEEPVVVDGNLVTAQGPAFKAFAFMVLEQLGADLAWADEWRSA